jgi:hypothetical protein
LLFLFCFCLRHSLSFTLKPYAAFFWNGKKVSYWGSMKTSVWTHIWMFCNSRVIFMSKCWILLQPVPGGVEGNLHFPGPFMNRLNHTEHAKFSFLLFWAFLGYSVFLLYVTFYPFISETMIMSRTMIIMSSFTTFDNLNDLPRVLSLR